MKLELAGDKIGKDENREELIDEYFKFFMEHFEEEIKDNLRDDFIVRNRYCKWSYI